MVRNDDARYREGSHGRPAVLDVIGGGYTSMFLEWEELTRPRPNFSLQLTRPGFGPPAEPAAAARHRGVTPPADRLFTCGRRRAALP